MKNKLSGVFLIFSVLWSAFLPAFAQSNNWESVRTLTGVKVMVQTTSGETIFGRIKSANNLEIGLQIAGAENYELNETNFGKSEIKKVWLAEIRFGERNMGKGALIGVGVGSAVGFGLFWANRYKSSTASVAVPVSGITGAGLGALVGFFVKKGHKKGKMIYSV